MADTHLIGALFYLRITSFRNALLSRVRRVKQPKYLIGAVFGIAYFYLAFLRRFPTRPGQPPGGSLQGLPGGGLQMFLVAGAIAALVFVVLCWVLRRERAALSFSEPEIAFLFPAPISRRTLIHYRLISMGLAAVLGSLILALVSRRWQVLSDVFAIRFVGWWLVFSTLSLHVIGSAFVITRWLDRGISPLGCQLLALAAVAVVVGLPAAWLWHGLNAGDISGLHALDSGAAGWLLFPFKLLLAPLLAVDGHALLRAVWPALLIYVAHYLWLLQVQVGFEEASVAKAEKRAARIAAMRAGNWRLAGGKQKARPAPFNLERTWRPELAFLWKNLLSAAPYLRLRNALIAAAIIVFACTWFADSDVYLGLRPVLTGVTAVFAAYMVLIGPQLARQDFRSDLLNTDILKTYPLRGWQIMLGEILTPTAILTVLIWLMLLVAAMSFQPRTMPHMAWLTTSIRTVATVGIALVVPLLCMTQLLVVNAAAVLFPAWIQPGTGRAQQGIEVMGQRLFFMFAQMLTMALLLLPPVLVAGAAFFLARWFVGDAVAAGLAALLVVVIMGLEVGGAVMWVGWRFERLDLSQELRP